MEQTAQKFCVKWNSYHSNLQAAFPRLLVSEQFTDVTLACEERQIRCHKLVLSACSVYFENLLVQYPREHTIIFMRDMKHSEIEALVDFMYNGEVNVTQEELPGLLKIAESLQIRGLCASAPTPDPVIKSDNKDLTEIHDTVVAQTNCDNTSSLKSKNNKPIVKKQEDRASASRPSTSGTDAMNDGMFYGAIDSEYMEFNIDEDDEKDVEPDINITQTGRDLVRTSTEIVTRHYISDHDIPMNINARPRIIGRRPTAVVNIETDVFQEKSYKQYSSQHLRDALIAVKRGYSVYAASNKYGVPRKTLRNWMEKYHIKSQFSKGRRGARTLDPLDLISETNADDFKS